MKCDPKFLVIEMHFNDFTKAALEVWDNTGNFNLIKVRVD